LGWVVFIIFSAKLKVDRKGVSSVPDEKDLEFKSLPVSTPAADDFDQQMKDWSDKSAASKKLVGPSKPRPGHKCDTQGTHVEKIEECIKASRGSRRIVGPSPEHVRDRQL